MEFWQWAPREREPDWRDWQAFGAMMQRHLSPFDLRALRQIYDAHRRTQVKAE